MEQAGKMRGAKGEAVVTFHHQPNLTGGRTALRNGIVKGCSEKQLQHGSETWQISHIKNADTRSDEGEAYISELIL